MSLARYCAACAKRLKPEVRVVGGVLDTVHVCKSPICRKYGQPQ